jgi:predicted amidohydrolase
MRHGDDVDENLARARAGLGDAARAGADVAVLPEYFFAVGPPQGGLAPKVRAMLARASRELGLAVAANVVEDAPGGGLLNVGVLVDRGEVVLEQPKIHPMPREAAAGVVGGPRLRAGQLRGRSVGLLVCADVLYPEAARVLQLQGAQLLLCSMLSPYRAVDNTKQARDSIFVARAYDSGAFLVKACGVRAPIGEEPVGIAGRSLVTAPWGVLARYKDDTAEELLFADLDFEELARFRKHQASFPARRPEAYEGLL